MTTVSRPAKRALPVKAAAALAETPSMTSGHQIRFRVAVGAVLVAGAAIGIGAWVTRDTDEERVAAVREHLRPAAQALHAAARPAGFQACANRLKADLCWDGQGSEVAAVPLLVRTLEEVGATDLTPRCVRKAPLQHVLCRVEGHLKGAWLDSLISINGGHLQVVVFAATQPPPNILLGGTPIPLSP